MTYSELRQAYDPVLDDDASPVDLGEGFRPLISPEALKLFGVLGNSQHPGCHTGCRAPCFSGLFAVLTWQNILPAIGLRDSITADRLLVGRTGRNASLRVDPCSVYGNSVPVWILNCGLIHRKVAYDYTRLAR